MTIRRTRASKLLVDTINATGGVIAFENGHYGPVGDPDWIDLGEAYMQACREEGVQPIILAERDWAA